MRVKFFADDNKFNVHAKTAEEATEAARKVHEELKKQLDMKRQKQALTKMEKKDRVGWYAQVER